MCLAVPGKIVSIAGRRHHAHGAGRFRRRDQGGQPRLRARGRGRRLRAGPCRLRHQRHRRGGGAEDPRATSSSLANSTPSLPKPASRWRRPNEIPRRIPRPGQGRSASPRRSRRTVTRPWTIMEVCGGQTHAIVRFGIDQLLPASVTLVHGPGCPVCVTPVDYIDKAIEIAGRPGAILLVRRHAARAGHRRRPARGQGARRRRAGGLFAARRGGRSPAPIPTARSSSSPSASRPPRRPTPWRSTGEARGADELLDAGRHVLVPPAMRAILSGPTNRVQGFLAAGHVCTIMGYEEYDPDRRALPGADRGHRLRAARHPRRRLPVREAARGGPRRGREPVRPRGAAAAATCRRRRSCARSSRSCRGAGAASARSPKAASALADAYADFDAELRFGLVGTRTEESTECIAGLVLQGEKKPPDCPAFGTRCTPEHPLGVTMVSSEGACAAYYRYRGVTADAAE